MASSIASPQLRLPSRMTSAVSEPQTFAALAAGRTDLKSLLPEQVWCYMLDSSHPSVVAAHGACENYYSTNTGARRAACVANHSACARVSFAIQFLCDLPPLGRTAQNQLSFSRISHSPVAPALPLLQHTQAPSGSA